MVDEPVPSRSSAGISFHGLMLMLSSGIYMSLLSPSQDQDAADLLDLCLPWSQVKPKYAAIKARLDQLETLDISFKTCS